MTPLLHSCLTGPATAADTDDIETWQRRWHDDATAAAAGTPFEIAVRGGFGADRLGWAFAAGYQAALRALLPGLAPQEIAGFCLTEAAGNRPRDLRTTLRPAGDGFVVDGDKRWSTLGTACTSYLVMCVTVDHGAADRPALRLVRIAAGTPGLSLEAMPLTAFVPEVPHAELHLRGVRLGADALLPGDGWAAYGKPFRTWEDILVTSATLAYLLREARAQAWPAGVAQRLAALLQAMQGIADGPADAPAVQVMVAGALDMAHGLFAEATALFAATPALATAARWQRDVALLKVASGARHLRAAKAWERLAEASAAR